MVGDKIDSKLPSIWSECRVFLFPNIVLPKLCEKISVKCAYLELTKKKYWSKIINACVVVFFKVLV